MAAHIEARSLSSLNHLADNPPQYPVNPAETPRESLTLYISRVPGTRDIILSTLKPQIKTISAEDVSNSLYYIHLQLPSEEQLVSPKRARDGSPLKTIPRKPLPSASQAHGLEDRLAEAPPVPSHRKPLAPVVAPHAKSQTHQPLQVSTDGLGYGEAVSPTSSPEQLGATPTYNAPSKRPLGPRSMGAAPPPPPPKDEGPPRTTLASVSKGPYQTPTSHDQSRLSTSSFSDKTRPLNAHRSPSPTKPVQRPVFTPSTLTLIRRDPSSNNQQNVARITSYQTNIPTPDVAEPDLAPDNMPQAPPPAINIRIDNPGYNRFRDWPTRAAIDKYAAEGNLNLRPGETIVDGPGRRARGASFTVPHAYEAGFNREVVMAYAKSWTSNIKSAFHMRNRSQEQQIGGDDDAGLATPRAPGLGQSHRRQDSAGSTVSLESSTSPSQPRPMSAGGPGSPTSPSSPIITRPGPGFKPKGYMFASPWDGRCEFRTGQGGRSLICRHVLDNSSSRLPMPSLGHGQDGTKTVSELRFNLPGSSSDNGQGGHSHARHSFHGKFDRLLKLDPRHRRAGESSDEFDDEEEGPDGGLDLRLGYERAGGGKRGNRTKLGKLIVHDEGLKMLDLVVAANIGMLWASFEKVRDLQ